MPPTPPHIPPSLWAAVTPTGPRTVALKGARSTDCVVIGAGFTGLSAALHLQRAGIKTIVLEAVTIGWGASGRNNGQVIPALAHGDPDDLIARYRGTGERFIALIRDSAKSAFDLIAQENIDAEAEQTGWINPAHSANALRTLERRAAQWQKLSARAEMLSRTETSAQTGSSHWHGAMHLAEGGHINPLALVHGLAEAFIRAGGTLHQTTTALSYGRAGTRWVTTTPEGRIDSRALIVATNAYSDAFSKRNAPELTNEILPAISWQLATAPLTPQQLAGILSTRASLSDTSPNSVYLRLDARNRIVTGGIARANDDASGKLKAATTNQLAKLFPSLNTAPPDIEYTWSGTFGITPDHLPRFHAIGPDGYAWTGCNGRGVALSLAVGQEFARAVMGTQQADLALPLTEPSPISFHAIKRQLTPFRAIRSRLARN